MELKPGYKWTEVGIIPNDWNVSSFKERFRICAGGDVNPALSVVEQDEAHPYPIYSNAITNRGLYGYCSYADHPACSITITARGKLGAAAYRDHSYTAIGRVLVLEPRQEASGQFFTEFINSRIQFAVESTGVPQLTAPQIGHYLLPVPPYHEQCAIAAALSDVDALLDGLDRLIAKKRELKQAVMQQLLTGQTRLPGFSAEWVARPLCNVGDIKSGGTPNTTQSRFWDGGVPWCTPTDVTALRGRKYLTSTARTISKAGLQSSSAEIIPPRSLIATSRATIGECAINLVPVTTNQGFKNIVTFAETDVEFLYYLMTTQKTRLVALCAGSTFPEIGKEQFGDYMITLPRDRGEQEAIAIILSDMDAEIASLEARRDKTRDLKRAMMQELLTGKTRLVKPEVAHA
ncbi:MAG: restriction endonuclease subunit S [Candidatus Tectomicrobia bacterium]|nr:restriction endonuclease subunit S [Candidatus Tectomicrobia bacterium]